MIALQSVVLRCSQLSEQGGVHGLVLSGPSKGKVVGLGNEYVLTYAGSVAFELSPDVAIGARVTANPEQLASLIVGVEGCYVLGSLEGRFDSYLYALSAGGELLTQDQIVGYRHGMVTEWQLVLVDADSRRTTLIEVQAVEAA